MIKRVLKIWQGKTVGLQKILALLIVFFKLVSFEEY